MLQVKEDPRSRVFCSNYGSSCQRTTMVLRFRALQSPLFRRHTIKKDIFILFSIEFLSRYELDLAHQVRVFYVTRIQGAIVFLGPDPCAVFSEESGSENQLAFEC
jgi:hypothetical protein